MASTIFIEPRIEGEEARALERLCGNLDWQLDNPMHRLAPLPPGALQQVGGLLWRASGLCEESLIEAIHAARNTGGEPVRLVVKGLAFQGFPWEMIHHGHPELGFLGRHPWCAVMRRVNDHGMQSPFAPPPLPLRILHFISSPEDLDPERSRLDFEREEELLFTALDEDLNDGRVDIDVAEDGALDTLMDRLERNNYHAVILSMHGTQVTPSQGRNEWGLLFEDVETGSAAPVAGSTLAARLDTLPAGRRPGLIVLSACRSARAGESADSIANVSLQLHQHGFRRVLGMRLSVLDDAAAAFSAELFRRLVLGDSCARAVTLARGKLAEGEWGASGAKDTHGHGDPFAQWTLPVLYDLADDAPLANPKTEWKPVQRPAHPVLQFREGQVNLPDRASFIGRRSEIRNYLRDFLEGKSPHLLLTGPGGVGKTALAGFFARSLIERRTDSRLIGFQAPFDLKRVDETLYDILYKIRKGALKLIQVESDLRRRIKLMLMELTEAGPCAFILDNLESIQDLKTLAVAPGHEESLWLVRTICDQPPPTRLLLTGRYAIEDLPEEKVRRCAVPDAPYGDVLRRMQRLKWPAGFSTVEKRAVYQTLGGNHRAIEWTVQLLTGQRKKARELLEALERVKVPPATPAQAAGVVLEAMRQNLLLGELRAQLTPAQDWLLRAMSRYRVPVNIDGLAAVASEGSNWAEDREHLIQYSLLESAFDLELDLDYDWVPPIVRELLGQGDFDPETARRLHHAMARYHRFQGQNVTRTLQDTMEAIYHLREADEHSEADVLAEGVCSYLWSISNFTDCRALTETIVSRSTPPPPWWALNRQGLCLLSLGLPDDAFKFHQRALDVVVFPGDKGYTFNNMGLIAQARGEYKAALNYFEQSLAIHREIGNKDGEGTALGNVGMVYKSRGEYVIALKYFEQSLAIWREIGDKHGEGTSLNNIGSVYVARGEYGIAEKYLKQGLVIHREIGNKAGENQALSDLGVVYESCGNYEAALKFFEQSLAIQREIGDQGDEAGTLNNIGSIYMSHGEYATARKYLEQSLVISREIGGRKGESTTLGNIGSVYESCGDYEAALKYFEQSLAIQREIGDKEGEGATLNHIGGIYSAYSEYEAALKYYEQSLSIRREIGNKAEEGVILANIGTIYGSRGEYETALKYSEQSLAIQRKIGDKHSEGAILANIGTIYDARGEYEAALKYYEQSMAILREIGDKHGQGTTLGNIGSVYESRGEYEAALKYYEQSMAILREIGDKHGEGTALGKIGGIYFNCGDYNAALSYLEQSRNILHEIGDKAGEGSVLNNLSQICQSRGDYAAALEYLEQSLAIAHEIGNKSGEGVVLFNLSRMYEARGDYETALEYLAQSLTIAREIGNREGEGWALNSIGRIHWTRGDYETALKYLEQSLAIRREIGDKRGAGTTLNDIGLIYLNCGDYEAALKYFEQSLAFSRKIGNKEGEGTTLGNIGLIYESRGEYVPARKYFEQSLAIRREIGEMAGIVITLNNLGHNAIGRGDIQQAFKLLGEGLQLARECKNANGLFNVSSTLGQLLTREGRVHEGVELLEQAIAIGRKCGYPETTAVEQSLAQARSMLKKR